MPKQRDTELATESHCKQMVPAWIQRMRDLASKHLTDAVVEEIVTGQIAAAKKGDHAAIRFVFDQLMGGQALRGATFVQNNYGAEFGDAHAKPTSALPGSAAKVEAMQQRAANGQRMAQPGDVGVTGWECVACGYESTTKPAKCPKCGTFTFRPVR